MHFHFSFYSAILLIFFTQSMAFAFLLLKKSIQTSDRPSRWLSFFVFLCAIYLLPWMLGFAGWYSLQPYRDIMFYVPFQQLLFIGPAIYFYTQCLLNPSFNINKKQWIHLLPGILYMGYRLVIFITDKMILNEYYFYADGRDKNLDNWYQLIGFISMLFYFVLSLRYYAVYKKVIYNTLSFADKWQFSWIKKYLLAFLLMQVCWLLFFLFYPNWGNFKEKWWYYISFSLLLYYIGITGYSNNLQALVAFKMGAKNGEDIYLLEEDSSSIATSISVHEEDQENTAVALTPGVEMWKQKIEHLILNEQLFQNPQLTLLHIAQKLNTNQTLVSKMVNQGFKKNFNDLINEYRVDAVIELLKKGAHQQQTLLGISIDCGFNSKTSFNRCFKKHKGISPKAYIEQLNLKQESPL